MHEPVPHLHLTGGHLGKRLIKSLHTSRLLSSILFAVREGFNANTVRPQCCLADFPVVVE